MHTYNKLCETLFQIHEAIQDCRKQYHCSQEPKSIFWPCNSRMADMKTSEQSSAIGSNCRIEVMENF